MYMIVLYCNYDCSIYTSIIVYTTLILHCNKPTYFLSIDHGEVGRIKLIQYPLPLFYSCNVAGILPHTYFRSIIYDEVSKVLREHHIHIDLVLQVHDHSVTFVAVTLH